MGAFSKHLGTASSLLAECCALHEGLTLARRLGTQFLFIELDTKVPFDSVWGDTRTKLLLKPLVLECRDLCQEFGQCRAAHIFKEANRAADFLAKYARDWISLDDEYLFWEPPSGELLDISYSDLTGTSLLRLLKGMPQWTDVFCDGLV